MVHINFGRKEVSCKIVFYGPGMSGKTTNLEIVHHKVPEQNRGELNKVSTDGDRTLFFDYMPLELGSIAGMKTKFQLYTVPGQVYYNSTRKIVLQGVDGVVFVADSSPSKIKENLESYQNLEENLREHGKDLKSLPHVIQFNKRDLPDAMSVEEMNRQMNPYQVPVYEAVAATGQGVFPTLKALSVMVLDSVNKSGAVAAPVSAPAATVSQSAVAEVGQSSLPSRASEAPAKPSHWEGNAVPEEQVESTSKPAVPVASNSRPLHQLMGDAQKTASSHAKPKLAGVPAKMKKAASMPKPTRSPSKRVETTAQKSLKRKNYVAGALFTVLAVAAIAGVVLLFWF